MPGARPLPRMTCANRVNPGGNHAPRPFYPDPRPRPRPRPNREDRDAVAAQVSVDEADRLAVTDDDFARNEHHVALVHHDGHPGRL
jgi:hypothetical protein